MGRIHVAR